MLLKCMDMDIGNECKLNSNWVLWVHDVNSKDWSINGYEKLCELNTISDFWKLFNNFNRLGVKSSYYLMRNDIQPTWEDLRNRDGGACSLKIEIGKHFQMWEDIAAYTVSENLIDNMSDINGISITPKNNWAVIKIWNANGKNQIGKNISTDLLNKHNIKETRYKKNAPEY